MACSFFFKSRFDHYFSVFPINTSIQLSDRTLTIHYFYFISEIKARPEVQDPKRVLTVGNRIRKIGKKEHTRRPWNPGRAAMAL